MDIKNITKTQITNLLLEYFAAFANKDIHCISDLLHDDAVLVDWNLDSRGIDKVIASINSIFSAVKYIYISPESIFLNISKVDITATCKIKIFIKDLNDIESIIDVVDIITLSEHAFRIKIKKIDAYKQ